MLAVAISNPKSHYCPLTVILSCSSCSALRLRSSSIRPASKLFFLLSSNVLPVSSEEVVLCLLAQSAGSITLDLFSSCVSDGGGGLLPGLVTVHTLVRYLTYVHKHTT